MVYTRDNPIDIDTAYLKGKAYQFSCLFRYITLIGFVSNNIEALSIRFLYS